MDKELVGLVSGILVAGSSAPYILRVWQGKTSPNLVSWALWSMIGLSLLLTYRSSGAEANVWPAVFSFINPTVIATLLILRKVEKKFPNRTEWLCASISTSSLVGWWYLRVDLELVQYALYLAIVADVFAAWPTISLVWRDPTSDRPFAWSMFAFAYGLAMFSIPENTVANWALPVWMVSAATFISVPLISYRVKNKIPITEWI